MKVTEQDVRHAADLAHLELTAEERKRFVQDLNSVIEYVDILNEVDTREVEPFYSGGRSNRAPLRQDEPIPGLSHETALMNAPATDGIFFQVPKVVERPGDSKK